MRGWGSRGGRRPGCGGQQSSLSEVVLEPDELVRAELIGAFRFATGILRRGEVPSRGRGGK